MNINEINQKIINEKVLFASYGGGRVHKTIGPVVRYRQANQWFSIDKNLSYDVTPWEYTDDKDGSFHKFTPIVVGGSVFLSQPDEGRIGLLTKWEYKNWKRPDGYRLIWGPGRYLRTSELKLTPKDIWQNIADEIDAGQNVFYRPLPGWE